MNHSFGHLPRSMLCDVKALGDLQTFSSSPTQPSAKHVKEGSAILGLSRLMAESLIRGVEIWLLPSADREEHAQVL